MDIQISSKFRISSLSKIERKLVRKRIAELESCNNLGEIKYGRLHVLRKRYSGVYVLRIGKISRLLIFPTAFTPDYMDTGTINRKRCIIGAEVYYSPNHYRTIY